jgi:hypothetical protein
LWEHEQQKKTAGQNLSHPPALQHAVEQRLDAAREQQIERPEGQQR